MIRKKSERLAKFRDADLPIRCTLEEILDIVECTHRNREGDTCAKGSTRQHFMKIGSPAEKRKQGDGPWLTAMHKKASAKEANKEKECEVTRKKIVVQKQMQPTPNHLKDVYMQTC